MIDKEAKELITRVFNEIEKSKSISDLEKIADQLKIPLKNQMDEKVKRKINENYTPHKIKPLL